MCEKLGKKSQSFQIQETSHLYPILCTGRVQTEILYHIYLKIPAKILLNYRCIMSVMTGKILHGRSVSD